MFQGKPREMVLHASRNGYYFTLDRVTGERLVTSKYSDTINWAKGARRKGPSGARPREGFDSAGFPGVAE